MIAFQISINGRKYCESEDISVLTMVAEEIQRRQAFRISLHAGGPDSPLQWLTANLRVGDEIAIRTRAGRGDLRRLHRQSQRGRQEWNRAARGRVDSGRTHLDVWVL
jgi:hypothetical protein